MDNAQIIYISHGGGPLPILGDASHKSMIDFMTSLPQQIRQPDEILVISAHWEERVATIQGAARPEMLYDYYGFPKEAYQITYPAPGSPSLAKRIKEYLNEHQLPVKINNERGFDHGLFIPLKMMYPNADIPAIQISLLHHLNPGAHIELGRALSKLCDENILVVGSGFSFHNMPAFSWDGIPKKDQQNDAFQDWLIETCTSPMPPEERIKRMIHWEKAPAARYCHPREEHLLPLHVCLGLAKTAGKIVFDDYILGKRAVAILW